MERPKRKTIAIDNDDVLIDFNGVLQPFHNTRYGTQIVIDQVIDFDLEKVWKCSREEAGKRVLEFYNSPEFTVIPPIPGSVEAIAQLKMMHDLVVISSRPPTIMELTQRSIDFNFPNSFQAIHLTNGAFDGHKKPKSQVCLEVGAGILIDDSPFNVFECAEAGITPILFRRSWNRSLTDHDLRQKNIYPAENWTDVVQIIQKLI